MSVSPVEIQTDASPAPAPGHPISVSVYVFFPSGGIGRYTNELVGALANHSEVSVEVACSPDFKWKDAASYPTWEGLQSISHRLAPMRRIRFLLGQFVNPIRYIDHVTENGIDIVHFSNVNQLTFPRWKRRLKASGARMVVSVHDVRRRKGIVNKRWEKRQLQAIYRFADALLVHSRHQADELIAFAGVRKDKIHIVPHGPYPHSRAERSREEARAKFGLPQDSQIALFFGNIRDDKNLDQMIEAIPKSETKPHLVVAGRGGGGRHRDVEYYRRHAKEIGVESNITFMAGFIPDEDVADLFVASDWVALPYRNSFTSQSGVLNVAAHYERPVLVSSAPVLRETVSVCDIGVACDGDTTADLARGIDRIAERVREGYVHRFQEYKVRFSWEENARRTIDVYRQLMV